MQGRYFLHHLHPLTLSEVLKVQTRKTYLNLSLESPPPKHVRTTLLDLLRFGPARIKALKKEAKIYFWDWARVESEGARYENCIAVHLLRYVHWLRDIEGEQVEMRYFRNKLKHEVDFVLLKDKKPWIAVEAKLSEDHLHSGLKYFVERVDIPFAYQVVLNPKQERLLYDEGGKKIRCVSAARFLTALP